MERMRAVLILVAINLGCATMPEQIPEPLRLARAHSLRFSVPNAAADAAWTRAQVFVAKYSLQKIEVNTDWAIKTAVPKPELLSRYGYVVTRVPSGAETQFEVECLATGSVWKPYQLENAHLAAYYISTGIIACEPCIRTEGDHSPYAPVPPARGFRE